MRSTQSFVTIAAMATPTVIVAVIEILVLMIAVPVAVSIPVDNALFNDCFFWLTG
jgi:hypothetical protein